MILAEGTEKLTTCGTTRDGEVTLGNLSFAAVEVGGGTTGEEEEEKESKLETSRFFVNTKGTCFLCLHQGGYSRGAGRLTGGREEAGEKEEGEEEGLKYCQWNIFRYLNINPCWIAQCLAKERLRSELSPAAWLSLENTYHQEEGSGRETTDFGGGLEAEENSEFSVPICAECEVVTGKMSRLCEELEAIQGRVDKCVETMEEIISKSDNDPIRREEFWKRLAATEGKEGAGIKQENQVEGDQMQEEEALHRKVVDMLRRETREKCLHLLKKSSPTKIKEPRLTPSLGEGEDQLQLSEQDPIIVKSETVETFVVMGEEEAIPMKMELLEEEETATSPLEEGVMDTPPVTALPFKEEPLDNSPSPTTMGPEEQPEWMENVPEVEQEISIGLCDSSLLPNEEPEELLFEEVPPLPLMEMEADDSPSPIILSTTSCLPPPPPPVNLPPKPPKVHKKKRLSSEFINVEGRSVNSSPSVAECPVDFYFHKKVDNRHVCPFCSDTSPTLTNLRFHVIRAHTEQLFSTSKLPHIPVHDFKSACELMLFTVTKEAETGERNASGTKVIVQCKFCKEDGRVYNDKRAFQCHLILNHYQMLTMRLMGFQKCSGKEDPTGMAIPPVNTVVKTEEVVISVPSPGNSDSKKRSSWVANSGVRVSPNGGSSSPVVPSKKKKRDPSGGSEDPNGIFPSSGGSTGPKTVFACEHCGKTLSSSTSKWRHKQLYCDVLRNRGEIPAKGGNTASQKHPTPQSPSVQINSVRSLSPEEVSEASSSSSVSVPTSTTSVYLITPQGVILNSGEIPSYTALTPTTTSGSSSGSSSSTSTDDQVNLDLLLQLQQQANDMLLKVDQDGGGEAVVGGDTDEYDQFVGSFQEFYEHEVNDALLDWMETGEEDPLQI